MFRILDNIFDHIGILWDDYKDEIDWTVQVAMLAYAVIFGLIMTIIVSVLS